MGRAGHALLIFVSPPFSSPLLQPPSSPRVVPIPLPTARNSHVSLVVGPDFLDADVVLGIDEGLGGGVGSGHGHHAGDVLVVMLVFHFDLWEARR